MDGSGSISGARLCNQRCGAHDDRECNRTVQLRSVCAQLLVDGVPNAKIVSEVLDVALPQHPGRPEGVVPLSSLESQRRHISGDA